MKRKTKHNLWIAFSLCLIVTMILTSVVTADFFYASSPVHATELAVGGFSSVTLTPVRATYAQTNGRCDYTKKIQSFAKNYSLDGASQTGTVELSATVVSTTDATQSLSAEAGTKTLTIPASTKQDTALSALSGYVSSRVYEMADTAKPSLSAESTTVTGYASDIKSVAGWNLANPGTSSATVEYRAIGTATTQWSGELTSKNAGDTFSAGGYKYYILSKTAERARVFAKSNLGTASWSDALSLSASTSNLQYTALVNAGYNVNVPDVTADSTDCSLITHEELEASSEGYISTSLREALYLAAKGVNVWLGSLCENSYAFNVGTNSGCVYGSETSHCHHVVPAYTIVLDQQVYTYDGTYTSPTITYTGSKEVTHNASVSYYDSTPTYVIRPQSTSATNSVGSTLSAYAASNSTTVVGIDNSKNSLDVAIAGKEITNAVVGTTYQLSYTGANTTADSGYEKYVSALIYAADNLSTPLYYGRLGKVTSASGTVDITLPSELSDGASYILAVFEETSSDETQKTYTMSAPQLAFFTAHLTENESFDDDSTVPSEDIGKKRTEISDETPADDGGITGPMSVDTLSEGEESAADKINPTAEKIEAISGMVEIITSGYSMLQDSYNELEDEYQSILDYVYGEDEKYVGQVTTEKVIEQLNQNEKDAIDLAVKEALENAETLNSEAQEIQKSISKSIEAILDGEEYNTSGMPEELVTALNLVQEMKGNVAVMQSTIDTCTAMLSTIKNALELDDVATSAQIIAAIQSLKNNVASLSEKVNVLTTQNTELTAENATLKQQVANGTGTPSNVVDRTSASYTSGYNAGYISGMQSAYADNATLIELTSRNSTLSMQNSTLTTRNTTLANQAELLEAENKTLTTENKVLKKDVTALADEIDTIYYELLKDELSLYSLEEELTLYSLDITVTDAKNKLRKIKKTITELKNTYAKVVAQNESLVDKYEKVADQNETLQEANKSLKETNTQLQTSVDTLSSQKETLSLQVKTLQEEKTNLVTQVSSLESENVSLKELAEKPAQVITITVTPTPEPTATPTPVPETEIIIPGEGEGFKPEPTDAPIAEAPIEGNPLTGEGNVFHTADPDTPSDSTEQAKESNTIVQLIAIGVAFVILIGAVIYFLVIRPNRKASDADEDVDEDEETA